MPRYRNTVESNKADFTCTNYESNGRMVTEGQVTMTHREQVPRTSYPMVTSGGYEAPRTSGGRSNNYTYQTTESYNFRSEVPIRGNSGGGGGGSDLVSYQGQGAQGGTGRVTHVQGQVYERWTSGPNSNPRRN